MSALVAYAAAVLIAVPFMDQPLRFVGPVSSALNGLDLSDVVSFLTAAILFFVLASRESGVTTGVNKTQETSQEPAGTSDP